MRCAPQPTAIAEHGRSLRCQTREEPPLCARVLVCRDAVSAMLIRVICVPGGSVGPRRSCGHHGQIIPAPHSGGGRAKRYMKEFRGYAASAVAVGADFA